MERNVNILLYTVNKIIVIQQKPLNLKKKENIRIIDGFTLSISKISIFKRTASCVRIAFVLLVVCDVFGQTDAVHGSF